MKAEETLEIIYEDESIIALNKPTGVNFDWVLAKRPASPALSADRLAGRPELLPVHRLDKDTSGIILFAKNEKTQEYLRELFQNHKIKKTYLALVVGNINPHTKGFGVGVKNNTGVIDLAIGRSKKTPLKRVAITEKSRTGASSVRGMVREAVTEYKIIKKVGGYTFLEAYPKTGRTHQIRSHFAAIGHPVVCDKLYSGKRFICPVGLTRQFLHAFAIEFNLPPVAATPLLVKEGKGEVGSRLRLEADLPEDLKKILDMLS